MYYNLFALNCELIIIRIIWNVALNVWIKEKKQIRTLGIAIFVLCKLCFYYKVWKERTYETLECVLTCYRLCLAYCDTKYLNPQCTCKVCTYVYVSDNCSVTQQSRRRLRQTTFPANSFCRNFDAVFDIYRSTITRDQGHTGAVINCIKLRRSKGKSETKYIFNGDRLCR